MANNWILGINANFLYFPQFFFKEFKMIYLLFFLLIIVLIVCGIAYYMKSGSAEISGEKMHEFYTGATWLEQMKKGNKTKDMRPGPLERYKKNEGKLVKYFHGEEKITVRIDKIIHYSTVAEALKAEGWKNIGPQFDTEEQLMAQIDIYYSPETVAELGGVNIFHLTLTDKPAATKGEAQKKETGKVAKPKPKPKPKAKKGKKERKLRKKIKHGGDPQFDHDYENDLSGL